MRLPRRFRLWRAVIYLKGEHWFAFTAEEISAKHVGNEITSISWERAKGTTPLVCDLREVQAVTVRPCGHHWRKP